MLLPSYPEAIRGPDIPSLVAPYLDLKTLQTASQVNKAWCKAMSRHIWADPMRTFASSPHPFYQAARFIEKSKDYATRVRELVTTIDYQPLLARRHAPTLRKEFAHYELYIGFQWILQDCNLFNHLRFIVIDGMTRAGESNESESPNTSSRTRILLLSAKHISFNRIENVINRAEFSDLMYLDLSYTCRPEELKLPLSFNNLRILKLRGLRLTKVPRFVLDLGTQLWSLDLRDNLLQDNSIMLLLAKCFGEDYPTLSQDRDPLDEVHHLYDNPPVYHRIKEGSSTTTDFLPLRPDSTSSFINYVADNGNLLRYSRADVLSFDDPMYIRSGLTQLYLSGNRLHSTIINTIFCSQNRLQVLDIGSVRLDSAQIPYKTIYATDKGCEKISPVSGSRLQELRIHHSAITQIPTILRDSAPGYDPSSLKQAEEMYSPASWSRLSPLAHHRLKSLTLTDIPTKSYGPTIAQLTALLEECAIQEQKLGAARASMPQNRRAPQVLSGLKSLRLEFLPAAPAPEMGSVSGDRDADGFLAKSLGDFSFFGGSGGAEWVEKKEEVKRKEKEVEVEEPKDVVEALRVFRRAQKPAGWGGILELVWPRGH
ncbi:hypothetical protein EG329_012362 [Mollisiaceae sp. DMI_Dod_QoI]|nr:hypothetical protein EG329_012362 [Helotiales sp. DMI_Dod_QoI]